jgi:hypothetical protein
MIRLRFSVLEILLPEPIIDRFRNFKLSCFPYAVPQYIAAVMGCKFCKSLIRLFFAEGIGKEP